MHIFVCVCVYSVCVSMCMCVCVYMWCVCGWVYIWCVCVCTSPSGQIMMGEGLIYCMQSRLKRRSGNEGSITAGGCNFNSFLRRTVRFVGTARITARHQWPCGNC